MVMIELINLRWRYEKVVRTRRIGMFNDISPVSTGLLIGLYSSHLKPSGGYSLFHKIIWPAGLHSDRARRAEEGYKRSFIAR